MATTIRVTDGTNRHSPGRRNSCLKIHEPGGATLKSEGSVPRFNLPFCKAFGDKRYQFCILLSQTYSEHRIAFQNPWNEVSENIMGEQQALPEEMLTKKQALFRFSLCCCGSQDIPIFLPYHIPQLVKLLPFNVPEAWSILCWGASTFWSW